jgi:formylglycine-generating enzyme required for sulfatase activity
MVAKNVLIEIRFIREVLLVLLFLFFSDSVSASHERGITVKVNTSIGRVHELSLYSGYYALIIGCGEYKSGWPMLPNPVKDAKEIADMFLNKGWSIRTVFNPNSRQLKKELSRLVAGPGRDPAKAILVWFSGHGHTIEEVDGTALGYLVPADAPDPDRNLGEFIDKAVSMRQIETVSRQIYSKHVLMIFDSCFSGGIFQMVRTKPSLVIEEKVAYPVRQFITAGTETEKVPDKSVFKDVFIQAINDGFADLNRDDYVTGEELGSYLYEQVLNYSRKKQHPQFGKINNPKLDKGDFVFELAQSDITIEAPLVEKKAEAFLAVDANIRGALVYLDGDIVGKTPLSKIQVSPGDHILEVEKEGYKNYRKRIQFNVGWFQNISVVLEKSDPPKARLHVKTEPSDAVIKILNIVPKFHQGITLPPGSYHLQVSADGWETKTLWVKLEPGEARTFHLILRRMIPIVLKNKAASRKNRAVNKDRQDSSLSSSKVKIAPGESQEEPLTGMQFVWIPEGLFKMGCVSESNECDDDEMPVHEVSVDGFWMGKYEVTLSQFDQFVTDTGYITDAEKDTEEKSGCWSMVEEYGQRRWDWKAEANWRSPGYLQSGDMPVVCVSWNDVHAFRRWISRKTGQSFRLPTEAEWEYACRAGSLSPRFWGDNPDNACQYANVADQTKEGKWRQGTDEIHKCSDGHYHASLVGSFKPNGFGLHDMLGNVWEWCEDVYLSDAYVSHVHKNPVNQKGGASRVIRGGCRVVKPKFVRSASRYSNPSDGCYGNLGFRLVRLP